MARRRKVPRAQYPAALERSYRAATLSVVDLMAESLGPLRQALPELLRQDDARVDIGEGFRLRALLERAASVLAGTLSPSRLDGFLTRLGGQVDEFAREQFRRQAFAMFGIDLSRAAPRTASRIDGFVSEGVSLIRSLPPTTFAEIEKLVSRGIADGARHTAIAKDIEERLNVARNRARLIARDQVGKLNGRVTRDRHEASGIKAYIWRNSQDERVRGNPTGRFPKAVPSHWDREGKRYSYDNPPIDGNPGEPILCRCYAEPDFSEITIGF